MPDSKAVPPKPIPEYIINDLETLKVLADPLRIQIIELVTHEPRTVKQVAAVLDVPPTKLYYHIKLLEERNLILVVDTRLVSGIIEKQYRATALSYYVDKALFSPTSPSGLEGLTVMLHGLFEDTRADIEESVAGGVIDVHASEDDDQSVHRALMLARNTLHLMPERADEFYRRLRALIRDFAGDEDRLPGSQDGQTYGLLVMLYPSVRASASKQIEPDIRTE